MQALHTIFNKLEDFTFGAKTVCVCDDSKTGDFVFTRGSDVHLKITFYRFKFTGLVVRTNV